MHKKLALLLAVILVASTALSGCSMGTESTSKSKTPVTINFMEILASPSRTAWLDTTVTEFEKANEGIKVERMVVPWEQAHDKIVTLIASKTLPDVLETGANMLAEFAAAGAYEDMQPYFDKWDGKDGMADISMKLGKSYDNKLYEMPYGLYIVNMMYRKDWLEAANVEVPKTISEYYMAMEKLTDKEKGQYGYAFRGGAGCWGLLSTLLLGEMGTGEYFEADKKTCTFRQDAAATALENFGNAYSSGYAPKDSLNWGYAETVDSFTAGVTGFLIQDTEVIGVCLDKLTDTQFATAMAPAGKDGKTYLIAGHGGFSISSFSKNKDQAWDFIKYMVSPEINAQWAQNAWIIPSNKKSLENPVFATGLMAPVGAALTDPNVVLYAHPDYLPEWGEFYSKFSVDELQAFLLNEQTAKETMSNVSDYLEAAQAKFLAK